MCKNNTILRTFQTFMPKNAESLTNKSHFLKKQVKFFIINKEFCKYITFFIIFASEILSQNYDSIVLATHCITTNNKPMIGKVKIRHLFLLAWLAALSTKAQVSSENYVQTTERISDTQVLSTTEYYDGLGRPFEMVEQKKTPDGANLIHLKEYDGLGRDW